LIEIAIPGRENCKLSHLVLDLNGTIALDGELIEGVEERLQRLSKLLKLFIISADTFGSASGLKEKLKAKVYLVEKGGGYSKAGLGGETGPGQDHLHWQWRQ